MIPSLPTTTLGRTGIEVSRLSLGGLFAARGAEVETLCRQTVERAYSLGIQYIDTAPNYGSSEEILGRIFREIGPPKVLSTKIGGDPQTFDPQNPALLRDSLERSVDRLGVDRIELLLIHEPDRPRLYHWWSDMARVEGPVLEVLQSFQAEGRIGHLGLGGTGVTELAHLVRSGKFDVVLTAFNYSLLFREAELVIEAATEQGVGVIAGSPLQQGAFAARYEAIEDPAIYWLHPTRRKQFQALYELSDESGLPLPEMAIRFVLGNPKIHTVLMGARTPEEVEQNAAAVSAGPLPSDLQQRLDEIAAWLPGRPFEEPAGMGRRLANPHQYQGPGAIRG